MWYVEAESKATSLDTSKVHSIDIVFENNQQSKSVGTQNGEYLTHPAFTFGDEELNGIWVGKFESGKNGSSETNSIASNEVVIKPNLQAWTKINVGNAFYTVKGMTEDGNVFGFEQDSDTHLMKNVEWGAVAYLSHSKYGTCTDEGCTEVYVNNNKSRTTGCGGDVASDSMSTNCENGYGTKEVYNQSTNGNISGIFDMSGGSDEFVMALTRDLMNGSGFTTDNFPEDKYVDLYSSGGQYNKRKLGDATGEMGPFVFISSIATGSWYDDLAIPLNTNPGWFTSGRNADNWGARTGIFAFATTTTASSNGWCSFRAVIA